MKITWNISQLDCYPQENNKTDVVFCVYWECNGIDGKYKGSVYSTCPVTLDSENPFISYANLTQDQVLNWIWSSGVNKNAIETIVAQQIENQKNPPVVSPPLPWITE